MSERPCHFSDQISWFLLACRPGLPCELWLFPTVTPWLSPKSLIFYLFPRWIFLLCHLHDLKEPSCQHNNGMDKWEGKAITIFQWCYYCIQTQFKDPLQPTAQAQGLSENKVGEGRACLMETSSMLRCGPTTYCYVSINHLDSVHHCNTFLTLLLMCMHIQVIHVEILRGSSLLWASPTYRHSQVCLTHLAVCRRIAHRAPSSFHGILACIPLVAQLGQTH